MRRTTGLVGAALLLLMGIGEVAQGCDVGSCQECRFTFFLLTTVCRFVSPGGTGHCYCDDSDGPCITDNSSCSVDDPKDPDPLGFGAVRLAKAAAPGKLPWEYSVRACANVQGEFWRAATTLR